LKATHKPIKLYSYPTSPFAQKVSCYLKYKNLDFEFIGVNPMTNAEIRFTKQKQVPVLEIGGEWRKESSELGMWLDELYPDKSIIPSDDSGREKILKIDRWITDSLIPTNFRRVVEWENTFFSIQNGWKLARAVHAASRIPWYARLLWPFAVKKAPFIVNMVKALDLNESMADRVARLQSEFIEHLGNGPFLGGQDQPTLADLSAFPIIVAPHFMGMKTVTPMLNDPIVREWSRLVHTHLPENPLLIDDRLLAQRSL